MALRLVGKTAPAGVTEVKVVSSQQGDLMDRNHQIAYQSSVNGEDCAGDFTHKKVHNTGTLPSVVVAVCVYYLSTAPTIKTDPTQGCPGVSSSASRDGAFCLSASTRPLSARPPRPKTSPMPTPKAGSGRRIDLQPDGKGEFDVKRGAARCCEASMGRVGFEPT
jgi:hypothetical protein